MISRRFISMLAFLTWTVLCQCSLSWYASLCQSAWIFYWWPSWMPRTLLPSRRWRWSWVCVHASVLPKNDTRRSRPCVHPTQQHTLLHLKTQPQFVACVCVTLPCLYACTRCSLKRVPPRSIPWPNKNPNKVSIMLGHMVNESHDHPYKSISRPW